MESLKTKWIKVYPSYIDKGLSYGEGRKVASSLAIENPTAREIFIACGEYLKIDSVEEYVKKNLTFLIYRNIILKIG